LNPDVRPLNIEEIAILKRHMNALGLVTLIISCIVMLILILISLLSGYDPSVIIGALIGMAFAAIFIWAMLHQRNIISQDLDNRNAEIIKGRVDVKSEGSDIFYLGYGYFIEVNGNVFDIKLANWKTIDVGDDIIIERAPASRIILNIKKSNPR